MKTLLILYVLSSTLASCGSSGGSSPVPTASTNPDQIAAQGGSVTDLNGKDGINGKDGTNGVDGKDGAPGKDGAAGTAGKDGAAGKDGVNGKDAPVIPPNEWYDAITKKYWLRLGLTGYDDRPQQTCGSAAWIVPDLNTLSQALLDGLADSLPSSAHITWADNGNGYLPTDPQGGSVTVTVHAFVGASYTRAPVYCIGN